MRFSNKAVRHWSLLSEGLLDRSLGTRALWEEGDVAGGNQGSTTFLSVKAEAGRGRGGKLRPAPRWLWAAHWRIHPNAQALELSL